MTRLYFLLTCGFVLTVLAALLLTASCPASSDHAPHDANERPCLKALEGHTGWKLTLCGVALCIWMLSYRMMALLRRPFIHVGVMPGGSARGRANPLGGDSPFCAYTVTTAVHACAYTVLSCTHARVADLVIDYCAHMQICSYLAAWSGSSKIGLPSYARPRWNLDSMISPRHRTVPTPMGAADAGSVASLWSSSVIAAAVPVANH